MRIWWRPFLLSLAVPAFPVLAEGDVILACTFESLPPITMRYPDTHDQKPTMSVDNRPPVEMTVGSGTSRFESAQVDGYLFRFSPANMWVDVTADSKTIAGEKARCARVGGPVNPDPLDLEISLPPTESAENGALTPTISNVIADVGSWDVKTSTSALDDSQTVILRQVADRKVTDKFGNGDYPVMIIRCLENTTSIYIVAGGHFLSDHQGYGLVEYRLDQGAKRQIEMKASTDNTALGLWRGRSAIPFLKSLFDKEIIVMRITPLSKAPAEFSFDIGGLSEAIVPLRNSCNW